MRGLYRGVWRGLAHDASDECVLGVAMGASAPSLETFAHATLAGLAVAFGGGGGSGELAAVAGAAAVAEEEEEEEEEEEDMKGRCLVVGLGAGGSLVRFLSAHAGAGVLGRVAMPVTVAEGSADVVAAVRAFWPGTAFELLPDAEQEADGGAGDGTDAAGVALFGTILVAEPLASLAGLRRWRRRLAPGGLLLAAATKACADEASAVCAAAVDAGVVVLREESVGGHERAAADRSAEKEDEDQDEGAALSAAAVLMVGGPAGGVTATSWALAAGASSTGAMEVSAAQRTSAVRVAGALSGEDLAAVCRAAATARSLGAGVEVRGGPRTPATPAATVAATGVGLEAPGTPRSTRAAANGSGVTSGACERDPVWFVVHLTTDGLFDRLLPGLRERLVGIARRVDAEQGWGLLADGCIGGGDRPGSSAAPPPVEAPVSLRVAEYHTYSAGGRLSDPRHYDMDSLVTIDCMLGEPGVDFTGGDLVTLEAGSGGGGDGDAGTGAGGGGDGEGGVLVPHAFACGDVIVFPSHKYHGVLPVTSGTRHVLVLELWRGGERRCPHRCRSFRGPCPLEPERRGGGEGAPAPPQKAPRGDVLPFRLGSVAACDGGRGLRLLWEPTGKGDGDDGEEGILGPGKLAETDEAWGVFGD